MRWRTAASVRPSCFAMARAGVCCLISAFISRSFWLVQRTREVAALELFFFLAGVLERFALVAMVSPLGNAAGIRGRGDKFRGGELICQLFAPILKYRLDNWWP